MRRSLVPRPPLGRRRTWRNHTGNQAIDPLQLRRPGTLDEVVATVQEAERLGVEVRAVGSGHSWSDVALTSGFVLEPEGLARPLSLEADLLHPGTPSGSLVRVEAGMRIRDLNGHLDREGLALSQMGGYDGQTVAGAISTSTHGSGLALGPLCDFVRSLDLVASGGRVHRIEPHAGLTDRQAYESRHPDRTLVQDDHCFDAALVGMGCLGVIYAVMLEVEPRYALTEVRTLSSWEKVKEELGTKDVLRDHRHYEVYLNPHRRKGRNACLVTTRDRAEQATGRDGARRRNSLPEFMALLPVTPKLLNAAADVCPSLTPRMLDRALAALADEEFTGPSYRVLNIGTANLLPAYSCEIGVPIDGRHIEAVERIMAIAERHRELGSVYHTSPVALRFVQASRAYMSMMHGRDTMMIELIQMTRTEGGFELLAAYEEALYDLEGRPHWGQFNTLTGSHDLVRRLYPRYDAWQEVHRQLNASRVFDGPFSKRAGISTHPRQAGDMETVLGDRGGASASGGR